MNRVEVLKLLQSHKNQLRSLGVKSLMLFGSVAKDLANSKSDVDVLVELDEAIGFFEFFRIKHYLENLLQYFKCDRLANF
jgi:predicted nucleotidyltransferase